MPKYEGFQERLKTLINSRNMKNSEVASLIKVNRSAITTMLNGKSNPSEQTLDLIARELKTTVEWLKYGEGPMDYISEDEYVDALTDIQFSGDDFAKQILIEYSRLAEDEKAAVKKFMLNIADEYKKKIG